SRTGCWLAARRYRARCRAHRTNRRRKRRERKRRAERSGRADEGAAWNSRVGRAEMCGVKPNAIVPALVGNKRIAARNVIKVCWRLAEANASGDAHHDAVAHQRIDDARYLVQAIGG